MTALGTGKSLSTFAGAMHVPVPTRPEPTPFPEVNAALRDLLSRILSILGDHCQGMYLDGSLALGDFSPCSSDIDYVVVTDSALSDALLAALRDMHAHFNAGSSPWATEVEALYVPRAHLHRCDAVGALFPRLERGANERLRLDDLGRSWAIHLYVLREHGIALAGPAIHDLIDPVDPDEIRGAMIEMMETWWGPMADDTRPLLRQHIGYQTYAVLTMCRVLYSLTTGAVASKPVAARWARRELGGRWSACIDHALAWRKDHTAPASAGDIAATVALIRFTLARCRDVAAGPAPARNH